MQPSPHIWTRLCGQRKKNSNFFYTILTLVHVYINIYIKTQAVKLKQHHDWFNIDRILYISSWLIYIYFWRHINVHGSQDEIILWHDLRRPALGGSTMATTSCDVMDFMVCVITSSALQQWYVTLVMPTVNRDNWMSSAQHMNFTGIICWKYDVNNLFKTSINDQLAQFL